MAVSEAVLHFSLDVYKESMGQDNLFLSPSSVHVVMAMIHAGAKSNTVEQMSKTLKLDKIDKSRLLQDMKQFVTALMKGSDEFTLQTANRLYPNIDARIVETYTALLTEVFMSDVKQLNFRANPDGCRQEINNWVEEITKQKINNLLPDGSVNSNTAMVVVNAIYFKGQWAETFEKGSTTKADFHTSKSATVKADMMRQRLDKARYLEHQQLGCKVLHLPYTGHDIGMVILLPNDIEGLRNLEESLNPRIIQEIIHESADETVDVSLPKFKMETSLQMKDILIKLGMSDLFDMSKADLTDIGERLYVSEVFHKAYVDVNEEGTEAAAATAAMMLFSCFMPSRVMEFNANHPFMFMIWDYRISVPLFMGRLVQP